MRSLVNLRCSFVFNVFLAMRKLPVVLILLVVVVASATGAAAAVRSDSFDFMGQDYGLERVDYTSDFGFLASGSSLSCGLVDVVLTSESRNGFRLTERGLSISPYPGNKVRISAGGRSISSVELNMYASYTRLSLNGEDMGVYTMKKINLGVNSAQCEIDFNLSSQNSIVSMTVTYDVTVSELRDAELRFSETECYATVGCDFTQPVLAKATDAAVVYSSSRPEVASVETSTGKIRARSPGTTVITARCEETSVFAAGEASYLLTVIDTYNGLGAILKTDDGTLCAVEFPLTVLYVTGVDTYVKQEGFFGLIRGAAEYTQGAVIPAGWTVRHCVEHGLDILIPYGAMPTATGTATAAIERVESVDLTMANSVVDLCGVIFDEATPAPGDKQYFTGRCGDRSYTFVNEYGDVPSAEAGVYDVRLAVSVYDGYLRLYPLQYSQCVSEVPQIQGERTFKVSSKVTLTATEGAEIYYTDNEADDLLQFTRYTAPLTLTKTMTLRAYAQEWGKQPSPVSEATFTREDSGIESLPASGDTDPANIPIPPRYITLQGRELPAPPDFGPYIEFRNGKVRKILCH